MPNLASARSRGDHSSRGGGGGEGVIGNRACYGIAASAVTLLLFCALAASVSVWLALAFGALALVAFGAAGCLAPAGWRGAGPSTSDGGAGAGAEGEAGAADAARAQRRFGLREAAIKALPTFAYTPGGAAGDDGGDLESGHGGSEPCSVCLEDFQAGEMVRQLPACKHLFHVECIDMWLQSHRTCPVCRCNLSPPQRKSAAKDAAPAAAPAVEAEAGPPLAEDALPPV